MYISSRLEKSFFLTSSNSSTLLWEEEQSYFVRTIDDDYT